MQTLGELKKMDAFVVYGYGGEWKINMNTTCVMTEYWRDDKYWR